MISFENLSAQPAAEKKAEKAEEKVLEKNKPENVSPPKENPEEAYKKAMDQFQHLKEFSENETKKLWKELENLPEDPAQRKAKRREIMEKVSAIEGQVQDFVDKYNESLPGAKELNQKIEELTKDYINFQNKQNELGKEVPSLYEIIGQTIEELKQKGKVTDADLNSCFSYHRLIGGTPPEPMKSVELKIDNQNLSDIVKEKIIEAKLKNI